MLKAANTATRSKQLHIRAELDVVRLLINNKANVNAQGGGYGNALQAASCRGRLDVVRLLINNKADVNAQGGEYGNALQAASCKGYEKVAHLLIEHGAETDRRDALKRNLLYHAVKSSSLRTTRLLLEQGVSPEDSDDANLTPFDFAVQMGSSTLIHLLLSYKTKIAKLSANDWRNCLSWAPDDHIVYQIASPQSIRRYSEGLRQFLLDESVPVTASRIIPWKRDTPIGSMSKRNV